MRLGTYRNVLNTCCYTEGELIFCASVYGVSKMFLYRESKVIHCDYFHVRSVFICDSWKHCRYTVPCLYRLLRPHRHFLLMAGCKIKYSVAETSLIRPTGRAVYEHTYIYCLPLSIHVVNLKTCNCQCWSIYYKYLLIF